jgi:HEAT repeat protein
MTDASSRPEDTIEDRRRALVDAAAAPGPIDRVLLARSLGDADWRVRKDAAAIAADRLIASERPFDQGALEVLVACVLSPDDVGMRNAAIEAFVRTSRTQGAPRAEQALFDALARAEPTARKFVCAALACGTERAIEVLAGPALDDDATTATAALEAISHIGGPRAEATLGDALRSEEPLVRLAAIEGLLALGARRSLAEIEQLALDPLLSRRAMLLAGLTGDVRAVPMLGARLALRANVAEVAVALVRLHDTGAAAAKAVQSTMLALDRRSLLPLRRLLDSSDAGIARAGAHLLALAEDQEALPRIAALAADIELGPSALAGLHAFGTKAVAPLLAAIPTLDPRARAFALEAVTDLAMQDAETHGPGVRAALRDALKSRDETVLLAAVHGLATWATPDDAPALVALGNHPSSTLAKAASQAVGLLARTAKEAVSEAVAVARSDAASAWGSAAYTLPPELALEKLREALSEDDPRTRRAAVEALADVPGLQAAELASMALVDEDADVQTQAIRTLSARTDPEGRALAESRLALELRSERPSVRAEAARALARLDARSRADSLVPLLEDGSSEVVIASLTTLAGWSDPRAMAALGALLAHADAEIVKVALGLVRDTAPLEGRLRELLDHPSWDVRHAAIAKVREFDLPALAQRLRVEADDLVKERLAAALEEGRAEASAASGKRSRG